MEENNKLFVGNLSWDTTEEALEQAFAQFGEIEEVKIIVDKFSGKSKGFAFVTFKNADDAAKAIEELNETELDGRKIFVNKARPQKPRE